MICIVNVHLSRLRYHVMLLSNIAAIFIFTLTLKNCLIKCICLCDNWRKKSMGWYIISTVKEKSEEKIIPYVSTYNPKDPEMFRAILDNVPMLKEDDKMRNILSKYNLIKSKRQPYNLKRLLTAKEKFTSNTTPKVTKCNKPTCGLCIHLLKGNSFTFQCGTNFKIHENMSCDVKMWFT